MKTSSRLILAISLVSLGARAQIPVPPNGVGAVVVERGPHHVVLQYVRLSVDAFGEAVTETNSYVQSTPAIFDSL